MARLHADSDMLLDRMAARSPVVKAIFVKTNGLGQLDGSVA